MTVRDISAHLSELSGTEIGRDGISRITDAVLDDVAARRTRPLERVYPIVYFDATFVKVREDRSAQSRACYHALGVTRDGEREVLGLWWQDTEGAKFWLRPRRTQAPRRRGCPDRLRRRPQRLPRRDRGDVPLASVQTCIVHLIRASLRYVNYRDLKKVASALRPI